MTILNNVSSPDRPSSTQVQSYDQLLRAPADSPPGTPFPILTAQVVVTADGQDLILTGRSAEDDRSVDLLTESGALTRRSGDATASLVNDRERRERVLRLALGRLSARYRESLQVQQLQAQAKSVMLSELRDYAIMWHKEDGEISRDSLDDFLSRFGLPAYRPSVRVEYTITGSYVVNTDSVEDAQTDAEGYLRPDLSRLDDVEDGSDTYTASVDEVVTITDA